jgi:hypothetical protein
MFRLEVEFEGEITDYEKFQEFINAMLDQFDVKLAPTHTVGWDIVVPQCGNWRTVKELPDSRLPAAWISDASAPSNRP